MNHVVNDPEIWCDRTSFCGINERDIKVHDGQNIGALKFFHLVYADRKMCIQCLTRMKGTPSVNQTALGIQLKKFYPERK